MEKPSNFNFELNTQVNDNVRAPPVNLRELRDHMIRELLEMLDRILEENQKSRREHEGACTAMYCTMWKVGGGERWILNSPVSQYERPRAVALASSACVDKTIKIITEFTRKDPFLRLKRVN